MHIVPRRNPTGSQRTTHQFHERINHPASPTRRQPPRQRVHPSSEQRLIRQIVPHPGNDPLLQQHRLDRRDLRRAHQPSCNISSIKPRIQRIRAQTRQHRRRRIHPRLDQQNTREPARIVQPQHPTIEPPLHMHVRRTSLHRRRRHPQQLPSHPQMHHQLSTRRRHQLKIPQQVLPAATHRQHRRTNRRGRISKPGKRPDGHLLHPGTNEHINQLAPHPLDLRKLRHPRQRARRPTPRQTPPAARTRRRAPAPQQPRSPNSAKT